MRIGLTGGIGSGKSYVCKVFNELGIPTFDSDQSAKAQYLKPQIKSQVIQLLGNEVYSEDKINKEKIASIIFNDKEKNDRLLQILSSNIRKEYDEFHKSSTATFTIFESGIIFERKIEHLFDHVICVITNDQKTRREKIKQRSGLTDEQINQVIANQLSDEELKLKSDYFIINDYKSVSEQCQTIYNSIYDRSKIKH